MYLPPRKQPTLSRDLPPNARGAFSPKTGDIKINGSLVENDDNTQTLRTLTHESRHNYQHYLVQQNTASLSDADRMQAQEWRDNFANYQNPQRHGYQAYYNQPVEADARSFAETIIDLLLGGKE